MLAAVEIEVDRVRSAGGRGRLCRYSITEMKARFVESSS